MTNWNVLLILHEIEFALRQAWQCIVKIWSKMVMTFLCGDAECCVSAFADNCAVQKRTKGANRRFVLKTFIFHFIIFFWFELRSYNVYCVCVHVTTWLWSLSAVVVCFTSRDYFLWHLPVSTCVAVVMFTLLTSHSDLSLISKWYVVRSLLTFDDSEFLKTAKFYFSFQDVALIGGGFNGPVRTCCTE